MIDMKKSNSNQVSNFVTRIREATLQAWAAIFLSVGAFGMLIAGVFIPPPGEIHPSVIQAVIIVTVIIAIFFAWDATVRGLSAKFEHGKTKVTVGGKSKRKKSDPPPNDEEDAVE